MYEDQVANALSLITAKGKAYVLREFVSGTPADPLKPWEPGAPDSESDAGIYGVKTQWTKRELDSGIKRSDTKLLVAALGISGDITTKMIIIDEDEEESLAVPFSIQDFELIDPNGEKILYILQLRR